MNNQYVMGYKVHLNITHFTPKTVLFSRGNDRICVSMVNDMLDYCLDVIAQKSPLTVPYRTTKSVISAIKMILSNKHMPRLDREDLETTVDVLKEIFNSNAESEQQKEHNERSALICKLLIDSLSGCVTNRNRQRM